MVQESRAIASQTYVTGYQWDDAGKLTQITYPSARIVSFGRDSNGDVGNVITKETSTAAEVGLAWWINTITDTDVASSLTKTLGYNAAGQLASFTVGGQSAGQYVYDYLSRLAVRTLPGSSTTLHYVHDLDGNIIAEYDGSGTAVREYIWLDERSLAVVSDAGTSSPVIYHVHTDHLERPVMMTDDSKNIVWKATYLPFGGIYTITGSATLDQRFPGQWFQLESGLHYNWHRHFDPTTGRYIQPDPLGMPDGPSRWAYVNNSPLMYVDPDGRTMIGPREWIFPNKPEPGNQCVAGPASLKPLFTAGKKYGMGPYNCQNVTCGAPHGGARYPLCPQCYDRLILNPGSYFLLENGKKYTIEDIED